MNIRKFEKVQGQYIDNIYGQSFFAYAMSDTTDFYDIPEWLERGEYPGSIIWFYDLRSGKVYKPFEKEKNVLYGKPKFLKESYYFLRADFNKKKISLFSYFPEKYLEIVTDLDIDNVNLYNLSVSGIDIHITSQDNEKFECYYPEKFSIKLEKNESVVFIQDNKLYISAWIEEGWDDENNCQTENYMYYDKVIIKDKKGNLLSEEIGSLQQMPDGTWWIA